MEQHNVSINKVWNKNLEERNNEREGIYFKHELFSSYKR